MQVIMRKFLVTSLPPLITRTSVKEERHYLYAKDGISVRVQKRNGVYELERIVETNKFVRDRATILITNEEYTIFKQVSIKKIVRDSMQFINVPRVTIKVYHGEYEGLIRAEVKFDVMEQAKSFIPFLWMGREITTDIIGNDRTLITLNQNQLSQIIQPN